MSKNKLLNMCPWIILVEVAIMLKVDFYISPRAVLSC